LVTERRCYLDANVLIAGWRGDEQCRLWARTVLDDPRRRFVVSDLVRLEVLAKPLFYRQSVQLSFMRSILENADDVPIDAMVIRQALDLAAHHDINPLDALHLAAALRAGVDELLRFARPEKPLCRQTEVRVMSLYALSQWRQP
jgi:predicted nucleic acid-binding protein